MLFRGFALSDARECLVFGPLRPDANLFLVDRRSRPLSCHALHRPARRHRGLLSNGCEDCGALKPDQGVFSTPPALPQGPAADRANPAPLNSINALIVAAIVT